MHAVLYRTLKKRFYLLLCNTVMNMNGALRMGLSVVVSSDFSGEALVMPDILCSSLQNISMSDVTGLLPTIFYPLFTKSKCLMSPEMMSSYILSGSLCLLYVTLPFPTGFTVQEHRPTVNWFLIYIEKFKILFLMLLLLCPFVPLESFCLLWFDESVLFDSQ